MVELSFVMKIITISLGCYFGHPLCICKGGSFNHRDAKSRKFWDESGTGSGSGKNNIPIIFSKHSLVASSGAGDIHFLRLRLQFLAKRFGGFWSCQKLPVHFWLPLWVGWSPSLFANETCLQLA